MLEQKLEMNPCKWNALIWELPRPTLPVYYHYLLVVLRMGIPVSIFFCVNKAVRSGWAREEALCKVNTQRNCWA
jgi:hypothetical protein